MFIAQNIKKRETITTTTRTVPTKNDQILIRKALVSGDLTNLS